MADRQARCSCKSLHRLAKEPGSPIVFRDGRFDMRYTHESRQTCVVIRYCFWCGGRAPRRPPRSRFEALTHAEQYRLQALTSRITSFAEAIEQLGPPDHDVRPGVTCTTREASDRGPVTEMFRVFIYDRLSETAHVRITERRDG